MKSPQTKLAPGTLVFINGCFTPTGQSRMARVKSNRGRRYKVEGACGEIWFYDLAELVPREEE